MQGKHDNPVIRAREESVDRCIPDLFNGSYSSVLYIGANQRRQHFLDRFEESGYSKIVVLEAFEKNYQFLKEKFEDNPACRVILGRAQEIETLEIGSVDVVFFWHGPEHLHRHEIPPTLDRLEAICSHVMVCGMPFGFYEQGPEYGNPYETHHFHIYPAFLENMGYRTETLGERDQRGSNITAWKYIAGHA